MASKSPRPLSGMRSRRPGNKLRNIPGNLAYFSPGYALIAGDIAPTPTPAPTPAPSTHAPPILRVTTNVPAWTRKAAWTISGRTSGETNSVSYRLDSRKWKLANGISRGSSASASTRAATPCESSPMAREAPPPRSFSFDHAAQGLAAQGRRRSVFAIPAFL